MAYRKFKRSRRSFGRRTRRRFRSSFRRRVRRIAYSIAEKKYWQYTFAGTDTAVPVAYGTAWLHPLALNADSVAKDTVVPRSLVNTIPLGNTSASRIGNKVFVEYIQLSMFVNFDVPAIANPMLPNGCLLRYGIYYDKQHGGNAAVLPNLFEPYTAATGYNYGALRNFNTLGKYKTLRDKQIRMAYTSSTTGTGIPAIQEYIPIKREFTLSTAVTDSTTAANMIKNDLGIFVLCSHSNMCYVRIMVRVCFRDA